MARPELVGAAELIETFAQAVARAAGLALDRAQVVGQTTGLAETVRTLLARLTEGLSWLVAWESLSPLERGVLALLLGAAVFLAWPAVRDAALGLGGLGLETLGRATTLVLRLRPRGREPRVSPVGFSPPAGVSVPETPPVTSPPAVSPAGASPPQTKTAETAERSAAGWPGFRTLRWQRAGTAERTGTAGTTAPAVVPETPAPEGETPRPAAPTPAAVAAASVPRATTENPPPEGSPPAPTPATAPPPSRAEGAPSPATPPSPGPRPSPPDAGGRTPETAPADEDDLLAGLDHDTAPTETTENPPPEGSPHDETDRAVAWLRAYLQDGPRPAREVYQAAQAVGLADRTLRRALRAAGIQTRWDGRRRIWTLPEET